MKLPISDIETIDFTQVFLEGEFYDVSIYWHLEVPCFLDPNDDCFTASVDLQPGSNFRFNVFSLSGEKVPVLSSMYGTIEMYDGSTNNFFECPEPHGECFELPQFGVSYPPSCRYQNHTNPNLSLKESVKTCVFVTQCDISKDSTQNSSSSGSISAAADSR